MTKDQTNAALMALTLVCAVACLALNKDEAGYILFAFATGHALRSPFATKGGDQ